MERTLYLITGLLFLFKITIAQTDYKTAIYNCFISSEMIEWKEIIDDIEKIQDKSNELILELINYQIGYIGWCIGQDKDDEAYKYLNLATKYLNKLRESNYELSYIQSYQGAIDGLKIGLNFFLAPFIGPGILNKAQSAINLNPQNANGYILLANSKYYMWAFMGGSKETALEYYHHAEKIMENNNITHYNWNYLSLLTMIAHAYEETEKRDKACYYYKKILQIEPEYEWVSEELYPNFLKKTKYEQ